jgi:hypothetical protein
MAWAMAFASPGVDAAALSDADPCPQHQVAVEERDAPSGSSDVPACCASGACQCGGVSAVVTLGPPVLRTIRLEVERQTRPPLAIRATPPDRLLRPPI